MQVRNETYAQISIVTGSFKPLWREKKNYAIRNVTSRYLYPVERARLKGQAVVIESIDL